MEAFPKTYQKQLLLYLSCRKKVFEKIVRIMSSNERYKSRWWLFPGPVQTSEASISSQSEFQLEWRQSGDYNDVWWCIPPRNRLLVFLKWGKYFQFSFLLQLVKSCRRNQTMREEDILDCHLLILTSLLISCTVVKYNAWLGFLLYYEYTIVRNDCWLWLPSSYLCTT